MNASRTFLPPLGPTGVETAKVRLGWFAGTAASDDPVALGWDLFHQLNASGSVLSPGNRHYSAGVRATDWSWQVLWGGRGDAAGTVYAEIRQGVWDGLGEAGWTTLAGKVLPRLRCSRVDLAGDVDRPCASPSTLFDRRAQAWTRTHRGGWELTVRGDGGEKLTVGSRSSDRYLRIYVKGTCVRHELELKGAVGRTVSDRVVAGASLAALWAGEYDRVVRWTGEGTTGCPGASTAG